MIRIIVLIFVFLIGTNGKSQKELNYSIQSFKTIPNLTIRSLEVINDSTIWFASNRGIWGYTENGGKTFNIDSIQVDSIYPEFRSLAVLNDSTVLVLSIASPAYLFKTTNKGKTWKTVYKNEDSLIFFNSMKFWDAQNGLAIGDPINGEIQIINTRDGGNTWKKVSHQSMPKLENGEAFFASSNTCFDFVKNYTWIATGGMNSRIIFSPDGGKKNLIQNPQMPIGEQMTGIYSVDFFDSKLGVVAGGNWNKMDTSITVMSITNNSGKTWQPIKSNIPVFGSCVQFLNKNDLILTGNAGTFIYKIKEKLWGEILSNTNEKLIYQTLRISPSNNIIWLSGSDGKIGQLTFN